ncbi:MAG TPA: FAD-binding oxidoreductase [Gaiellaceae bacterium]|nr:FAD-binding oxidoreductase [Gaiellaceae bacterium]
MESHEVVVVGGGAMGASTAWHLRELGVRDVVLLERVTLASGSTSKSAGGIRTQFADELNVRIALRSLDELARLGDEIDLRLDGYLFLLDSERDLAAFRAAVELQNRLGVPSRLLSPEEARAIVPQLEVADLAGASFCERDGYATPEALVQAYARGLDVRQGCTVDRVLVSGGRVEAVETSAGRIETGCVVLCSGVWTPELAATAGIELPVRGEARRMWFSPADGGFPERLPLTIDFATGFYFHRSSGGIAFGGRETELEDVAPHAEKRCPALAELPVQSSWWGWYELSPDHNAIVGESADVSRLLYATGFSGHGFQQAPAVGEHLAELVAGRAPTLDLSPFALERFARGAERRETFFV